MKPWIAVDADLVVRIKNMVAEALGAARSLEMALEVTRQSLTWADQLIEGFESVNPLPNPIACHLGCSFCCHNEVEVTPPEVFLIAQMIRQYFSPQRQERLKEKILISAALKFGKSTAELAATRQARPCPLLEEDKCVVYPWRPLSCRAMHSLDREHCRTSHAEGDLRSDEYYLHRYTFPLSLAAGLTEGFGAVGCQAATLELSQALREVLWEPHLMERWLRGEEVFNHPLSGEHQSQE
jgi:Fe-S-cluster containining protein